MPFKKNILFKTTRITVIAIFAAVAISIAALLGWIFDFDILSNFNPNRASMKVNTALEISFSGVSLLLFATQKSNRLAAFLAFTVFLVGAVSLSEYLFHWNAHIDELFFRDYKSSVD